MHTSHDWQTGYDRLMTCLMHDDDVKCECCRKDRMTKLERIYYTACWLILAIFAVGFCAWLMFSTYPAVLYP